MRLFVCLFDDDDDDDDAVIAWHNAYTELEMERRFRLVGIRFSDAVVDECWPFSCLFSYCFFSPLPDNVPSVSLVGNRPHMRAEKDVLHIDLFVLFTNLFSIEHIQTQKKVKLDDDNKTARLVGKSRLKTAYERLTNKNTRSCKYR